MLKRLSNKYLPMKKMPLFFIIAALVSCAQKDFSKLEKGTSVEEMVKEYGEPDDKVKIFMGIEAWRYSDNLITIFGDKVTEVKLDYDSAKIFMEEARAAMKEVKEENEALMKELDVDIDLDIGE